MSDNAQYERIKDALGAGDTRLSITFHPSEAETPFTARFAEFVDAVKSELKGALEMNEQGQGNPPAKPALTLTHDQEEKIHYLALPDGPEEAPFFDALTHLAVGDVYGAGPLSEKLAEVEQPAELLVFIAPTCPHCPQAVKVANQLALANPKITASIIDVQQFPELAGRFAVSSVPLTVMDNGFSFTGVVPAAKVAEHILARGSDAQRTEGFLNLIEGGRVAVAVRALCRGSGLEPFLHSWKKSVTSQRIGLMMAAEEALEENEEALDRISTDLLPLLAADDAALRGDTADLLGRIGLPHAVDSLKALLNDPNPDVAEIAEEAIKEIEDRDRGID
jgi:thioredoxin-like negative regulator of GroEL